MGTKLWDWLERMLRSVLIRFLHLSFLESRWDGLMQFVKFGLVGVSNTLIMYVVYLAGLGLGMHYVAANVIGFLVSVINAFYWNNRYVFALESGQSRSLWRSFCKTFLSYAGTGLILNNILLFVQVDILHISRVIAPLVNLVITIPLNFLLNKLWAFRKE